MRKNIQNILGSKTERIALITKAMDEAWKLRQPEEILRLTAELKEDPENKKLKRRLRFTENKTKGAQKDLSAMSEGSVYGNKVSQNEIHRLISLGCPMGIVIALKLQHGVRGKFTWIEFMIGRELTESDLKGLLHCKNNPIWSNYFNS